MREKVLGEGAWTRSAMAQSRVQHDGDEVDRQIDQDEQVQNRLKTWTVEIQLPTITLCERGQNTPVPPPHPLKNSQPSRGIDRGSLIAAPNNQQLENWLHKHGFLAKPYKR